MFLVKCWSILGDGSVFQNGAGKASTLGPTNVLYDPRLTICALEPCVKSLLTHSWMKVRGLLNWPAKSWNLKNFSYQCWLRASLMGRDPWDASWLACLWRLLMPGSRGLELVTEGLPWELNDPCPHSLAAGPSCEAGSCGSDKRKNRRLIWLITARVPRVHTDVLLPPSGKKSSRC